MSDRNLAILVRQLALHCSLAAQIQQASASNRDPYSSNWLERLRQIKRIRDKVVSANNNSADKGGGGGGGGGGSGGGAWKSQQVLHDFTKFVLRRKDE